MTKSAALPKPRPKRRHPAAGGYARGGETRSRIIAAALEVFGTHGFGGASTRMLADRAGVTLPALQYYFDGKLGVYLACAEHIAGRLALRLEPVTQRITKVLAAPGLPREHVLQLLDDFIDGFADLFLGAHEVEKWVLFIIREQAQPTQAFDIIYDRVMRRVLGEAAALVGRLMALPSEDPRVRIRTLALIGQIIFFRTGREAALRALGWPDFDGERLQQVKDALHAQIAAAFGAEESGPLGRPS